jgi:hypothetical protein
MVVYNVGVGIWAMYFYLLVNAMAGESSPMPYQAAQAIVVGVRGLVVPFVFVEVLRLTGLPMSLWLATCFYIAAAIIAGLLTSIHAYPCDCVLLIPVALILFRTGVKWMQMAAGAVLLPVWYLSQYTPTPLARVLPAILLVLFCAVSWMVITGSSALPYPSQAASRKPSDNPASRAVEAGSI